MFNRIRAWKKLLSLFWTKMLMKKFDWFQKIPCMTIFRFRFYNWPPSCNWLNVVFDSFVSFGETGYHRVLIRWLTRNNKMRKLWGAPSLLLVGSNIYWNRLDCVALSSSAPKDVFELHQNRLSAPYYYLLGVTSAPGGHHCGFLSGNFIGWIDRIICRQRLGIPAIHD